MIMDADEAVDELVELAIAQGYAVEGEVRPQRNERPLELIGDQRRVFDAVTEDTTPDQIADITELDMARVSGALSELELTGMLVCQYGRWNRVG